MKKLSRARKTLLCALIGSSLFWPLPIPAYAAEEAMETAEEKATLCYYFSINR